MDFQRLPVVPRAVTDLTWNVNVRQKVHFDLHKAVAAAGFAPAALDVEAEPSRPIAPDLRLVGGREQVPDIVEQPRVGGGVASGSPADGALVDVDDLVQILHAVNAVTEAGTGTGMVQRGKQGLVQNFIDQTGFSRAGHAGDADEGSQRNLHIHIFQIVLPCAANTQEIAVPRPPGGGNGDFLHAGEVLSRYGTGAVYDILQRSRRHDLAAVTARAGANVYDKIGGAHGVLVVLHHDQGVAQIPQMLQRPQQLIVVPLVQTDGGFIQNIQHAHQRRTDLGGQPDPLALAAGKGSRRPGQGQVAQSHIRQELQAGLDLLDDLLGHHGHTALQTKIFHKFQLVPDAHAAKVHNADAAHRHRPGDLR